MTSELVQKIAFGAQGDDANYIGAGWSGAELGYRWMVGEASEIWLENPGPGEAYVLVMDLAPFCAAPKLTAQRLAVQVRGRVVGRSMLTSGRREVAYRVPADLLAGKGPIRIVLRHPDAARPSDHGRAGDTRPLALVARQLSLFRVAGDTSEFRCEGGQGLTVRELEARVGMPAAQFMLHFESLGDNCEFGLVQRRCGAEPLGLLRFSNLALGGLLRGLRTGFAGLVEGDNLNCALDDRPKREYVVREKTFSFVFHTFLYEGEVDETTLLAQQATRLKFLRRKLLEDVASGEKIFVWKRNEPTREDNVRQLHAALCQHAPNTLLWVVPAEAGQEPGSVEVLTPGLLKGYVDRLAPNANAHDLSFEVWLGVCARAWDLVRQHDPAGRPEPARIG